MSRQTAVVQACTFIVACAQCETKIDGPTRQARIWDWLDALAAKKRGFIECPFCDCQMDIPQEISKGV